MKNLLLILATILILSCTKKQDDPKPVVTTTQKQSNPVSSCNKDSSWTRTHPSISGSLYSFRESCTKLTISFKLTGQTVTITKPTNNVDIVTNWKDLNAYRASTDPKKIYYYIRYSTYNKSIIYHVNQANWKDLNAYRASTDPKKIYYYIRYSTYNKSIIYDVNEANSMGVGGSGMKMP